MMKSISGRVIVLVLKVDKLAPEQTRILSSDFALLPSCLDVFTTIVETCCFKSNISCWFASTLSLPFYIFSPKMEENRKGTQGQNRSESNSNVVLKNYIVKNQQEIHQRPKISSLKTVSQ